MGENRLCILILNWNSIEDTTKVVDLLRDTQWSICVVDNGSSDISEAPSLKNHYPDVHVIQTGMNLGYAGGMNTGMRWARAQGYSHVLLLNPDTAPTASVIEDMVQASKGYAVVGTAQVTDFGESYISAANLQGRKVVPFRCETSCGQGHEVDIVSGAAILIELATAESLGYMDQRFFHYKEEFDFCYRVTSSGARISYNCKSALVHRRGGSLSGTSSSGMYYTFRNEVLFLRKHFGRTAYLSSPGLYRMALRSVLRHPNNVRAITRGIYHGVLGITGPLFDLTKGGNLQ